MAQKDILQISRSTTENPICGGESERELLNTRRLFLQLLENFPDGSISIIDRNYNFVCTGGELHKRLNLDINGATGKKMYPQFPEPLRVIIRDELAKIFQGDTITEFELPYKLAGHSYVMDAFPLLEEQNEIKRAGVIIRNVSKIRQAEEDLRNALEKERELNELKSRFVSMASHEFRTPLSTILSSTYLITKYTTTEDQPKREKHLERIISSVSLLTDILNDFLSLGKIEEGKITVRPAPIDIPDFFNSIISEISPVRKKDQVIEYRHTGERKIDLDKSILKNIALNLLSNAIKFSYDDSLIRIETRQDSNEFRFSVKDNGIGIAEEDQKHLFERFFRGENAIHTQGTGLGLHIVSRYAELMHGKVSCKSELGKGTELTVIFSK